MVAPDEVAAAVVGSGYDAMLAISDEREFFSAMAGYGRIMQRIPRWEVDVSTASPWRAAGR